MFNMPLESGMCDLEAQGQSFLLRRHNAQHLGDGLAMFKGKHPQRLPHRLQLMADNLAHSLQNRASISLTSRWPRALPAPSKQQFDDREGQAQVNLQHAAGISAAAAETSRNR